ncbi:MAG: hypothetical protein ACI81P_003445 [Neolewinella sp.]|jgi:hypothetical protein
MQLVLVTSCTIKSLFSTTRHFSESTIFDFFSSFTIALFAAAVYNRKGIFQKGERMKETPRSSSAHHSIITAKQQLKAFFPSHWQAVGRQL